MDLKRPTHLDPRSHMQFVKQDSFEKSDVQVGMP
jgi:hypothetical protein